MNGLPQTRWLTFAAATVVLTTSAYFIWHEARMLGFPFPLDYGEGALLEQARLLGQGRNIYRPDLGDYPFTIANYPPLFPFLLAVLAKPFGLTFAMGRAVTLAATLTSALLIAGIVWTSTHERVGTLVAAAAFLASPYVVFWSSLVRIDLVALALSLGAVLLVLAKQAWRPRPFVAAALILAAAMTRQTHLLAGPLAVTGALWLERRRLAVEFVVALATGGALVVAVLAAVTHGGFLVHTVTANANHYSFPLLRFFLVDLVTTTPALGLVGVLVAADRLHRRRDGASLLALYLLGTALSALTIGKVGSHVNYFLELTAALAIMAGIGFTWRARTGWRGLAVPTLVLVQIGYLVAIDVARRDDLTSKIQMRAQFEELRRVLDAERGEVLADETMGMLVLTNHALLLQPFEYTQLSRQGIWNEGNLVGDIRRQRFALVLINDGPATPASWVHDRWSDGMLSAVHDAYQASGGLALATLYRPKRSP